jgi:hypothetical protein
MTASKTKKTTKKVVRPSNKVYMVLLTCPSHGQGIDDVDLTEGFRTPARVIEVVEKSVEEADVMLGKLTEVGGLGYMLYGSDVGKDDGDGGIDNGNMDEIEDEVKVKVLDDEMPELGDIFPDSDDDANVGEDIDFMDALEKLDEEETEPSFDLPDGLPEL